MANLFRCSGGGESLNCIAKVYDENEVHNKGDVRMVSGILYICLDYNVTGPFDESKWSITTLNELSEENPNVFYGIEWMDNEYNPDNTYNTDDTCMFRGLLFICLEDNVTGEWDESKWKRTYLLECTKLNSNLSKKKQPYFYGIYSVSGQSGCLCFAENECSNLVISGGYHMVFASADGATWSKVGQNSASYSINGYSYIAIRQWVSGAFEGNCSITWS